MRMGTIVAGAVLLTALGVSVPAGAFDASALAGTWKWGNFTVEAKPCTTNPSGAGMCMTVVSGPKNVGMEMIRSKFQDKGGGEFAGKIAHPASGEIYNAKMRLKGDTLSMNGCTDAGVCAKGDFIRQK